MNTARYDDRWYLFRCNNCGWTTPGTFNWNRRPEWEGATPDTDCPKCGSHDSVTDTEQAVPVPADIAAVVADINTGARAK